jgi:hypothetical protein
MKGVARRQDLVTGGSNALTTDQLTGRWNLVSIQPASQAEQAVPQGASYILTFAGGRLSTRVPTSLQVGRLPSSHLSEFRLVRPMPEHQEIPRLDPLALY